MATRLDDGRPLGELVGEMTRELSQLMRQEIELAKTETKEELAQVTDAGKAFGAGAFLGYLAALMLAFAAAWALAAVMPTGLAFLIVGIVLAGVAVVALMAGRKRMQGFSPVPEQTVETLKEDVEWARARKS